MKAKALLTESYDASVERRVYKFDPLYSGGPAYIDGFDLPVYVDLATLVIDPSPVALLEHDYNAVVGHLENIVNDGERVCCDAVVGGTTYAQRVIDWAEDVGEWTPSIGVYRIDERDVELIGDGVSSQVNGRDIIGPCYVVHNGALCEGSFVAIGGDGEARAIQAVIHKGKSMRKICAEADIEQTAAEAVDEAIDEVVDEAVEEAVAQESDAIIDEIVTDAVEEAAATLDEIAPEIVDEVVEEIIDEIGDDETIDEEDAVAVASYAQRMAKRKLKAHAGLSERRRVEALKALSDGTNKRVIAQAIARGWSVERTNKILEAQGRRRRLVAGLNTVSRNVANNAPRRQDILCASLAHTLGMSGERIQKAFGYDQRVVDAAMSKEYRNATLRTVVAESNNSFKPGSFGVNTTMLSAWNDCRDNCRRAQITANAGFSTISATEVFTLVLQAFLEPSQETAPRLYNTITRTNTLADFNTVSSYLPTLQGRLREISETGAIQNIGFTTEKFDRATKANGINFTIPEMVIINDQIDVFAELLRQFETLGDDCVEHDVAETFWRVIDGDATDSQGALVSTTRGNYITGASLDEAGISSALTALSAFSTANGVPLAIDSAILVTGNKLSADAMKLYAQEYVNFANGTATPNIYRGRFQPYAWAYFDKAHARAVKDDGTTTSLLAGEKTWVMLRNPQKRPVVCVNKLVGYESPQIRQFDYDPAVWGLTYQLIYPYSVSTQYADGIVVLTNA